MPGVYWGYAISQCNVDPEERREARGLSDNQAHALSSRNDLFIGSLRASQDNRLRHCISGFESWSLEIMYSFHVLLNSMISISCISCFEFCVFHVFHVFSIF